MKPGFDSDTLDCLSHNSHRLKGQSVTKYAQKWLTNSLWFERMRTKTDLCADGTCLINTAAEKGNFFLMQKKKNSLPSSRTNNDRKRCLMVFCKSYTISGLSVCSSTKKFFLWLIRWASVWWNEEDLNKTFSYCVHCRCACLSWVPIELILDTCWW